MPKKCPFKAKGVPEMIHSRSNTALLEAIQFSSEYLLIKKVLWSEKGVEKSLFVYLKVLTRKKKLVLVSSL